MNTATGSNGAERICINEDMTIYHAETLKKVLMQAIQRSQRLELDLSQVAEIDTSGIQLLMLAKRESQTRGQSLDIIAHSPAVHELIDFFNIAGYLGDPLVIPARPAN
ncbi:MAG: STAS domain-containing protein [Sterolibacterium sp.]|nr:STAS domain-containing protein [Sterolibacterium sp.]